MKKPVICIVGLLAAAAIVVLVTNNLKTKAEKDLWSAATDDID